MDSQEMEHRVQSLVQRLATGCQYNNLGSATVAIYDTAWVSMVSKVEGDQEIWLFPECFQYLLESQLPNGGWKCYSSRDDGLLNTLAALLAMKMHTNAYGLMIHTNLPDIEPRILRAKTYVQESLHHWAIDESLQVGFEILVPALLSMLQKEDIHFEFPGKQKLDSLNASKLATFNPEMLYNKSATSLHSLEAFIGRVDFDRLGCYKTLGSMMASPASTAAFLMQSSVWDIDAESYLRNVIYNGSGKGNGGVPCVFPMPIFEITWILSTVLEAGYTSEALGRDSIDILVLYIQEHLQHQQGVVGFAPSILADADDSAKALLTLSLLGRASRPDRLIDCFRSENGHFRTYPGERDASFSANCNVLKAILHSPNVEEYSSCITDIVTFLSDAWWSGTTKDKWVRGELARLLARGTNNDQNKSPQYSMMLLAEAFIQLLLAWDKGLLKNLPESLLRDRIPVVLIQILNRTMLAQNTSGAWSLEEWPETTAYGVLTLMTVCSLPWYAPLKAIAISVARSGQGFLDRSKAGWSKPAYVWVEKVTFGSAMLSEAYCLAAMKASETTYSWSDGVKSFFDTSEKHVSKLVQLFSTLAVFQPEPRWKLMASVVEGSAFLPLLKSVGKSFLPEQKEAKNEYLAYIPSSWIIVNNCNGLFLDANLIWDMMVLTVCNFRVDEYMESAVAKLSNDKLEPVKSLIYDICSVEQSDEYGTEFKLESLEKGTYGTKHLLTNAKVNGNGTVTNGVGPESRTTDSSTMDAHERYSVSTLTSVRAVLNHYIRAMLNYPRLRDASTFDKSHFRNALCKFLLSHTAQIADNSNFATQSSWNPDATRIFSSPRQSFYTWVHATGAESVSCPFSFAFLTCLLGAASAGAHNCSQEPVEDCFKSTRQKYLAQELCTHLAVMSRLYNDFGSVERDRLEANINSINFPEFHNGSSRAYSHSEIAENGRRLKEELLELAEFERQSVDVASENFLRDLDGVLGAGGGRRETDKANAVKLFIGVSKLYADLYVARDLSNRIVASS